MGNSRRQRHQVREHGHELDIQELDRSVKFYFLNSIADST